MIKQLVNVEAELKRLQELDAHVKRMFDQADEEGLFIGLGYKERLSISEQEGPMVKKLRKLARK